MERFVRSPYFRKKYPLLEEQSIVRDASCPIDRTPLVLNGKDYSCLACGAKYIFGTKEEKELRQQAASYVAGLSAKLKSGNGIPIRDVPSIYKIIGTAMKKGLIDKLAR